MTHSRRALISALAAATMLPGLVTCVAWESGTEALVSPASATIDSCAGPLGEHFFVDANYEGHELQVLTEQRDREACARACQAEPACQVAIFYDSTAGGGMQNRCVLRSTVGERHADQAGICSWLKPQLLHVQLILGKPQYAFETLARRARAGQIELELSEHSSSSRRPASEHDRREWPERGPFVAVSLLQAGERASRRLPRFSLTPRAGIPSCGSGSRAPAITPPLLWIGHRSGRANASIEVNIGDGDGARAADDRAVGDSELPLNSGQLPGIDRPGRLTGVSGVASKATLVVDELTEN